ncbi:MAG TPA: nucleotidyltransferase domain-containing protein [Solirubrobacteraceae bacterium]|nr:nucleotidyltransferase domain-containing protein [Solirubrobacteraceae bacterium]
MTVIDEHARIPALDEAALGRLTRALDRDGVVAAMLIGSHARGTAGPLSDIDIAFWHEPSLHGQELMQLRLELARDAAHALGTDEVDIVALNHAPPLIRQRAIRDGRRLLERSSKARVRLEARAIVEYLDTIPLREELARGQRHRIEEGRFGRR